MRGLYDMLDIVKGYGVDKLYEHVREHIYKIVDRSQLNFVETDEAVVNLYQKYAFAYAIATKARCVDTLVDLLFEDTHDPIGNWQVQEDKGLNEIIDNLSKPMLFVTQDEFALETDSLQTFPNSYGSDEQHLQAMQEVLELFTTEMESQTGLFALFDSLLPGEMERYFGDDYFNLVVVCNANVSQLGGHL